MQKEHFLRRVQQYANIETREMGERLCNVVLGLLSVRLTEEERRDLISQLPWGIKEMLKVGEGKEVIKFHKDEFLERVMKEGQLENTEMAERAAKAVFKVLKEQITKGEADDVTAQLPKDLKEMWVSA
jgi:uncharacterized protein (DUF2267 family)